MPMVVSSGDMIIEFYEHVCDHQVVASSCHCSGPMFRASMQKLNVCEAVTFAAELHEVCVRP